MMKVLIIGSGGREHALAWKAAQSHRVKKVFVAPGNAGTAQEQKVKNVAIGASDINALVDFAGQEGVALAIVGPEAPLVKGITEAFSRAGLDALVLPVGPHNWKAPRHFAGLPGPQ